MLKQQIQEEVKNALRAGDQFTCGVLRMAISVMGTKEKEKRYKILKEKPDMKEEDAVKESALSDEEVTNAIVSEIKKRKDAIALYKKGGRPELAENEKKEIAVLQKYLPEQLPQEELKKLVEESVKKTGATSMKDMGKIMADLMPKVKGKADNSEISNIIKELLK
ncbi:GatB/YqeY domain-containing protein [Candidatus Parcubacteria bacterium]|nr:GatB/YqeY domain-containing protein [Candidatus Parcubacteria bacterium]